jgi:hypothetical protein
MKEDKRIQELKELSSPLKINKLKRTTTSFAKSPESPISIRSARRSTIIPNLKSPKKLVRGKLSP